jgi:alginate O-acetyltransferase complex protein AlgJ
MTIYLIICRLALPTLFLGYGIVANIGALVTPQTKLAWPTEALLSGGLTRDFEHDYKTTLLHYDPAFGAIGALRYSILKEARSGAAVGIDGWLFTSEDLRGVPENAVEESIQKIKAIQLQLAQHGVDLVMLPIPAKIDIADAKARNSSASQEMAQLYEQFVRVGQGQSLPLADARADMRAAQGEIFFATDTHWTRSGAQIAARAVAKVLPLGTQSYAFGPAI